MASTDDLPEGEESAEAPPAAPPKRGPGHRGQDVRDTMAEMAAKAHEISLEAGSRMAGTMREVVGAAAGLTPFAIESARDLVQYMVRRGQMSQDEADKLMREVEEAHGMGLRAAKPEPAKVEAPKKTPPPAPAAPPVTLAPPVVPRPVKAIAPEPTLPKLAPAPKPPKVTAAPMVPEIKAAEKPQALKGATKGATAKAAPARGDAEKAAAKPASKPAATASAKSSPAKVAVKAPAKPKAKKK